MMRQPAAIVNRDAFFIATYLLECVDSRHRQNQASGLTRLFIEQAIELASHTIIGRFWEKWEVSAKSVSENNRPYEILSGLEKLSTIAGSIAAIALRRFHALDSRGTPKLSRPRPECSSRHNRRVSPFVASSNMLCQGRFSTIDDDKRLALERANCRVTGFGRHKSY